MSECRRCDATIKWVRMEDTQKLVPIEPIPSSAGTVAARLVKPATYGFTPSLVGYVTSADRPLREGYRLYVTHYVECQRNSTHKAPEATQTVAPAPTLFDQPEGDTA